MTIKIKAPVIWLDEAWLTEYVGQRLDKRDKKYRIIRESDWRKMMKLVRAVEACDRVPLDVCRAIVALRGKGK